LKHIYPKKNFTKDSWRIRKEKMEWK